jgi:hypothetical protein
MWSAPHSSKPWPQAMMSSTSEAAFGRGAGGLGPATASRGSASAVCCEGQPRPSRARPRLGILCLCLSALTSSPRADDYVRHRGRGRFASSHGPPALHAPAGCAFGHPRGRRGRAAGPAGAAPQWRQGSLHCRQLAPNPHALSPSAPSLSPTPASPGTPQSWPAARLGARPTAGRLLRRGASSRYLTRGRAGGLARDAACTLGRLGARHVGTLACVRNRLFKPCTSAHKHVKAL